MSQLGKTKYGPLLLPPSGTRASRSKEGDKSAKKPGQTTDTSQDQPDLEGEQPDPDLGGTSKDTVAEALENSMVDKASLLEAAEAQVEQPDPKLGSKPKPNKKPGKAPVDLGSTGETASNSPAASGESLGSRSSRGDTKPPPHDAAGQEVGSGAPLDGEFTCLEDRWWRVWISSTRLNQIGVHTPHTGVFLFCLFFEFPGQAKRLMPGKPGLEVYSCHFDISFEIPSDMFCMLTEGDRPERDSLELFIDGEWALYGTEVEACDPSGVSYQHKASMAGALHGQDTQPEARTNKTGQTEAQVKQTKEFLREMQQSEEAAKQFKRDQEHEDSNANVGLTGCRGLPTPGLASSQARTGHSAGWKSPSAAHRAGFTALGVAQQVQPSSGLRNRTQVGPGTTFGSPRGRSSMFASATAHMVQSPKMTANKWANPPAAAHGTSNRASFPCIRRCRRLVFIDGQMCETCANLRCKGVGCPNKRSAQSDWCDECTDQLLHIKVLG